MNDLVRAYINLDPEDKSTLERHYGHGWSQEMRSLIHKHCISLRDKRTFADYIGLENDNG